MILIVIIGFIMFIIFSSIIIIIILPSIAKDVVRSPYELLRCPYDALASSARLEILLRARRELGSSVKHSHRVPESSTSSKSLARVRKSLRCPYGHRTDAVRAPCDCAKIGWNTTRTEPVGLMWPRYYSYQSTRQSTAIMPIIFCTKNTYCDLIL